MYAEARYAEDGALGRALRKLRYPTRALAMALAAVSLAWGITLTAGLVAAVTGAIGGVILGEVLAKGAYKSRVLVSASVLGVALAWWLGDLSTSTEIVSSMWDPGGALIFGSMLRYGGLALGATTGLRVMAARYPSAVAIELVAVVVAIALLFASHRDGVIARPLWISDWAWQQEIDPADIFLGIGAASAILLAILLVLENKGGRTASSLFAVPLLALIAIFSLDVVGRPAPEAEDGIGLTDTREGDPPNLQDHGQPYDGDRRADGGGRHPEGNDGGRGGGQEGGDGGRGGGGGDAGDGGASGGQEGDGGAQGMEQGDGSASGAQMDGGAPEGGAADGGGASSGGDAGDGGGASSGGDAGDGGGASSGSDGGDGGSSGGDSGSDAGGSDGGSRDASMMPPPPNRDGGGGRGQRQGPPSTSQQLDQQQSGPSTSPAPMAVVIFDDDYSPPAQGYYFRQEVWSELDTERMRLVPTTLPDTDQDVLSRFPTARTRVDGPDPRGRTKIGARVAMLVEHQHPFSLESPIEFAPTANPNPDRFVRAYRFTALAQSIDYRELLGQTAGDHEWTEEVRAHYLETHPDERFKTLAEEQVALLPPRLREDPFAKALIIKEYLDRELIYSTRERHAEAADPTSDFLFGNKTGYCVHFAHAAVFLWRSVGVPARIGTGYMVPEENRRGGSAVMLKSGDAHAWPEIYLDGLGWIVLDISAARNLDPPGQAHDEDLQRMLAEMAREEPQDPQEEPQAEPEDEGPPRDWGRDLGITFGVLLALALLVLYGTKLYRRVRPAFASQKALPRVAYRATLDRLAEAGLTRAKGESREGFAERVAAIAPSLAKLTALHVEARLGPPERIAKSPPSADAIREHARAVSRELRSGTKWWRRALGLLHPAAFFDAR